jgi:hypothetical protein
MTEIDLDAIQAEYNAAKAHEEDAAGWYYLGEYVPALLARIAELEAARLQNLAAAEASGYERAVARLRDLAAMFYPGAPPDSPGPILRDAADHLDAVKESTDGH